MGCQWAGQCSGCPWITDPYQEQLRRKREHLRHAWREAGLNVDDLGLPQIHSLGEFGLRDRVEMTLHRVDGRMRFGLYDTDRSRILDLTRCPQMSPAMVPLFDAFRADLPELPLGAARLRVSPQGEWGLWLHFPNVEIERFLAEGTWLQRWCARAHVEMGQRRRAVTITPEGPVLALPEAKPWFETYIHGKPQALFCHVGSFTQPGYRANARLVQMVTSAAQSRAATHWLELGAGIGNFTLPLAAGGGRVTAVDNDPAALANLNRAAREAGLACQIQTRVCNMHHRGGPNGLDLDGVDAVMADPPRSGLRAFAQVIADSTVRHMIYVSCFAQSLAADAAVLTAGGFRLETIAGLDQFPGSPHCEWVALLTRQVSETDPVTLASR